MYVKLHKSYRTIVAVCDSDLIGKTFEEGIKQLEVRESFYKGEDLDYKKVIELMKKQLEDDATFNIVGEKAIKAALEAEIIDKAGINKIDGIPYALVLS